MKRLGIVAGLGVILIFVGLVVAVTPVEVDCVICDGSGKTDCVFCTDGSHDCIICEDGKKDCIFCTDGCEYCDYQGWKTCTHCNGEGLVDCSFCNGRGWDTCTFCDGTGKEVTFALLIPGAIIVIIGITLVPTAFIVSRD